jgi:osmotically-inducible protein OsmY/flavin-binding protein dodecin
VIHVTGARRMPGETAETLTKPLAPRLHSWPLRGGINSAQKGHMDADEVGSTQNDGSGRVSRSGLAPTDHEIGVSNHVVKVVEILAESSRSWEDAARVALREAVKSLRNITSIYVKDLQAIVRDGHVAAWRVNAKVSFVVGDQDNYRLNSIDQSTGGQNMGYRNQNEGRDSNYRPWREGNQFPEYEEYGLHGDDRRSYRGRESYEQQSRGGQGGRSGMWPHRNVPRDQDEPFRNNADEDRRGYQNLGSRAEFESANRSRPDYGRYGQSNDRDYDDPRFGFDARDYGTTGSGNRPRNRQDDHRDGGYGNRDYGRDHGRDHGRDFSREYGAREYGGYDRADANRYSNDDYSRTDYGERTYRAGRDLDRDFGYDSNRDYGYGTPYSRPSNYSSSYDQGNDYRRDENRGGYAGNHGSRSWSSGPERGSYDQGRLAQNEYGRSQFQSRSGQGPKGYKRSDERIREDVCDRLGQDWDLDASEVEVSVSNGEVTLAGTINDRQQKFRVEHIADSVSGVNEVHNQLRVKRELQVQGSAQTNTQQTGRSSTANQANPTNQNRSS